jgi:hypothetical protein
MSDRHRPLNETLTAFREAGLELEVRRGGKHLKVRADRLTATVAATPSDRRRSIAKRLVKGLRSVSEAPSIAPTQKTNEEKSKARLLLEERKAELAATEAGGKRI